MSNLLEQAIVDAAALREVAMKNAESALIEKYSKEFKESVEKLLEQEAPVDAGTESPPITDPSASGLPDPLASGLGTGGNEEKEKAFDRVPSSFLDGDEDEVVTIDFDQLKKQVASALGGGSPLLSAPLTPLATPAPETPPAEGTPMLETIEIEEEEEKLEEVSDFGARDEVRDALFGEDVTYEDKLLSKKQKKKNGDTMPPIKDEELELDEDNLPLEEDEELQLELDATPAEIDALRAAATADRKAAELGIVAGTKRRDAADAALKNISMQRPTAVAENIEISEQELQELAEELKVDINIDNLSDGHPGTTTTQKREQRNLEFAAANDSKATQKREEEKKEMAHLKKQLDEAIEASDVLLEENKELEEKIEEMTCYLQTLKENVEKLSISNAKLLYTNKVLGNVSLNERQKEQIVENISKSTSVLEAKTIYNTLQSTVSGANTGKPKESLSEAINRSNSPFLTRKQPAAEIPFADRLKKLAGII